MSKHAPPIYVEILIAGTMDALWCKTQNPAQHQRWDLRFSRIEYLPRPDVNLPQQFLYATRIGFGLDIQGAGESVGEVGMAGGVRTSALKFWSDDWKSLIREGSGYWKYTPLGDKIRFETGYDYTVRFGWLGEQIDRRVFRPLIGWATAWSFDRLRLWMEQELDPAEAMRRAIQYWVLRLLLGVALPAFLVSLVFYGGSVPTLGLFLSVLVLGFFVWRTRGDAWHVPSARHCRRQRVGA